MNPPDCSARLKFGIACLVSLISAFMFTAPAAAASPQSAPSVESVLARYVQALGGEAALRKPTTRVMRGAIQFQGASELGSVEVYAKAPNKGTSTTYVPGDLPFRKGTNGSTGWYVDTDEGPKDMTGTDLADLQREFDFYRPLHLKEHYPNLTLQGAAPVAGRDAQVLEVTLSSGEKRKLYFDAASGLLVREDVTSTDGTGTVSTFEDYREVDGVKYPFTVRRTDPDTEMVIRYSEIRHNVPLEDAKFEKPAR